MSSPSTAGSIAGALYCITEVEPPGGQFPAEVKGNQVIFHTGTVGGGIMGASVTIADLHDVLTAVRDNHVTVEDGTIGSHVIGAVVGVYSSAEAQAVAATNIVTLSGGTINSATHVRGGDAYAASTGGTADARSMGTL